MEQMVESGASVRAAEALLEQIGKNTSNLTELQDSVNYKVNKHIDVRENLLKKKEEELQKMQTKMDERMKQEAQEQSELRSLVESLERQIRERELEIKDRENALLVQKEQLSSEIRKFNTEKEITLSHLKEEQMSLRSKETNLAKEKSKFRSIMELEHRNIISRKMKLVVSNKLEGMTTDPNERQFDEAVIGASCYDQNQLVKVEMEALADAFKDEELKICQQKEQIQKFKSKIDMKKKSLKEKEKVIYYNITWWKCKSIFVTNKFSITQRIFFLLVHQWSCKKPH